MLLVPDKSAAQNVVVVSFNIAFFFFVWWYLWRLERVKKPEDHLDQIRACPACTYDLTGLPDFIPHEWIAAHASPRRCLECGEPWPLVPRTV